MLTHASVLACSSIVACSADSPLAGWRATAGTADIDGIYGILWPDPEDPDGKLPVTAALGTFDGTLSGHHSGEATREISGERNLGEPAPEIYCAGPFSLAWMR